MVPSRIFFVKGVGTHRDRLASFEAALRAAGIEKYNLVYVSSIFPANCKEVRAAQGMKSLVPGQIVYCVMARSDTNEPNRLISSAIGVALPTDGSHFGYLSEHHAYGETGRISADYAEDLAATMLATTQGVPFDPNLAWNERKQVYMASGGVYKTKSICQSAEGDKNGLWTTTVAAAILLLD